MKSDRPVQWLHFFYCVPLIRLAGYKYMLIKHQFCFCLPDMKWSSRLSSCAFLWLSFSPILSQSELTTVSPYVEKGLQMVFKFLTPFASNFVVFMLLFLLSSSLWRGNMGRSNLLILVWQEIFTGDKIAADFRQKSIAPGWRPKKSSPF